MIIPAMETMTLSDNVLIIEKMPLFQSWGVLPTSVAMVPAFVFTSVNMVSKFDVTHPVRSSFMKSVSFSIIPPINYPNRVASCGIRFIPISTMPPPAINCFIPCDFAPGLSVPYPSSRLITPQAASPAPIAQTNVFKVVIAVVKNAISVPLENLHFPVLS